jgi:hypothetical protein
VVNIRANDARIQLGMTGIRKTALQLAEERFLKTRMG